MTSITEKTLRMYLVKYGANALLSLEGYCFLEIP